ncbi:DUF5658 family protein [Haloplanus aerogenes]|uniref:DUF5658 domain-containing protein n=1 Tax=Haloplanus aerogenes TaxID=660522 RepID=A0A3M0DTX1_9EURY|nr:DUF5658 family protein [Haloplanus aerogenes]AZH25698.1 hypothetical protein DU502_10045 [Haloplanus aerogenes]RMB25431.1 hypothetical protein ATH50_0521 [Haloplanus aerogenes]
MSTDTAQSQSRETVGPAVGSAYLDAVATRTTAHASWLWAVALASLVADGVLTIYGIRLGLTEVNPVAADLIASVGALSALALLKGGAVGVAVAGWVVMPDDYRGLVPAGLALPWVVASVMNVVAVGLAL